MWVRFLKKYTPKKPLNFYFHSMIQKLVGLIECCNHIKPSKLRPWQTLNWESAVKFAPEGNLSLVIKRPRRLIISFVLVDTREKEGESEKETKNNF